MIIGLCVSAALAFTAPTPVVRYDAGEGPKTRLWIPVLAYNRDNPRDPFTAPDPKSFAAYAADIATKYKNRIVAYEVWNEPNLDRFWRNPDPVAYSKVYIEARKAIKLVDPKAIVLAGGIADVNSWQNYAKTVIKLAKPDALALHPYIDPVGSTSKALKLKVPIWITEVGVGSTNISPIERARYTSKTIRTLRKLPIKALFTYSWHDPAWSVSEGSVNLAYLNAIK